MKFLWILLLAVSVESRNIEFSNKCGFDIWINPLTNDQGKPLGGIAKIGDQGKFSYPIPQSGWAGRFWPKTACDENGVNCKVGQSVPPCGPNGCFPPAETKVEFFFPPASDNGKIWYDVSLVDGYSLPVEIEPSILEGSCNITTCAVSLDDCPTNEQNVGDLRVIQNGKTVQCLAPCKKWNYPAPFGHGHNEQLEPGKYLCCPTPPVSPTQCREGIVVQTEYVKLVHRKCPTAYSYSYDDEAGLHHCPNNVDFKVTFCPPSA